MAIFEWRKFNFFNLKSNADQGKLSEAIKEADITCSTNGNNQIIICDSYGCVHLFDRSWAVSTFKGHTGPIHLCELSHQHNLLITIGNEITGILPVFKIWNLSKASKVNGGISVPCVREDKIVLQRPTAMAICENGHYFAIGFDSGSISLYRGDISRDRSKNLKYLSFGSSPITGIAFKQYAKVVYMFVCSDAGVNVYNLQVKDREIKTVLDRAVDTRRCSALQSAYDSNETHFMVGMDDAVYCYTTDGRGPCYALEGEKSLIQWFRSHLLTVSKQAKNTMSNQKESVLTVIDILNKFIVFSKTIESTVAILIEFGTCYIVTANKTVYHLDEKDLQSKLNLLFNKNLYDIAVRIAKSNRHDSESLAEIFQRYGDYLYTKGDFMGAVEQYIRTIGYLEPSYIIRRFLDSRHINCLTDYLQALHNHGKATPDHTTLLLNCFTRLDRTDQLKQFLSNDRYPSLMFDLDVAIKVLRAASVGHALDLAKTHCKYDSYISILTEDNCAYADALNYIADLPFEHAKHTLRRFGHILMKKCPQQTTELLKKICTDYFTTPENLDDRNLLAYETNHFNGGSNGINIDGTPFYESTIDRANPEDFIHLFTKAESELLVEFLEHLLANVSNCSKLVYNALIEHYLHHWKTDAKAEKRLLEILRRPPTSDEQNIPYDRNHVLILCSTYEFWPGIMYIYEEQQLYHLIVRYYLKNGDYNNLMNTCKRLGKIQPTLWLQAMTGLRDNKTAPLNLLPQVLQVIAQEKLQSPLQILSCLAVENGPQLSNVRDYFVQVFQKDNEAAKNEGELVEKYRRDAISLKGHIKRLTDSPIEFRGNLCDTCNQVLTMPSLYFLCQHAYHQDCIRSYSESDKDCPVCHSKNMQLIDVLQAQNESRAQHEQFHNLLNRSHDPFSVVAEYFAHGMFNKIVIVDEKCDDINQEESRAITQKQQQMPPLNPYDRYGAGAESKMRLTEGNQESVAAAYREKPMSEARIRGQEKSRYAVSSEVNSPRSKEFERRHTTARSAPRSSQVPTQSTARSMPKNPFDDDDATANIIYDESKNPFANDDVDSSSSSSTKTKDTNLTEASTNPFGEFDD